MIGLEYIVKLYEGTYKQLAEKLGLTPSTVTDWISKRRPIPKAKLEALSKLFKIDEEYFQKELNEVEKVELHLDYLKRKSKRDSFEISDYIVDQTDGKEYEITRTIDPYEDEQRMAYRELDIEKLVVVLRGILFSDLYEDHFNQSHRYEILNRLANALNESVAKDASEEEQNAWEKKHYNRIEAFRSFMYFMGVHGFMVWDEGKADFHTELFALLKKYDLLWGVN